MTTSDPSDLNVHCRTRLKGRSKVLRSLPEPTCKRLSYDSCNSGALLLAERCIIRHASIVHACVLMKGIKFVKYVGSAGYHFLLPSCRTARSRSRSLRRAFRRRAKTRPTKTFRRPSSFSLIAPSERSTSTVSRSAGRVLLPNTTSVEGQ